MSKKSKQPRNFQIGSGLNKVIGLASSFVPFFSQITQKDIEAINAQATAPIDFMDQAKNTANIVIGRITGYNPFPNNYQVKATRNVAGIFNGWTFLGLGMTVIGRVTKRTGLVPHAARMESYGKKIMLSGAAGGFFDDNKFGGGQQTAQQKPQNNFRAMRTPDQLSPNYTPAPMGNTGINYGSTGTGIVRLSQ